MPVSIGVSFGELGGGEFFYWVLQENGEISLLSGELL
jgi:hypothetical protein